MSRACTKRAGRFGVQCSQYGVQGYHIVSSSSSSQLLADVLHALVVTNSGRASRCRQSMTVK